MLGRGSKKKMKQVGSHQKNDHPEEEMAVDKTKNEVENALHVVSTQ